MQRRITEHAKGIKKVAIKLEDTNTEPEGYALFCLSPDTAFRKSLFKLVKDDRFDAFIITCILLSTMSLCF